MLENNQIIQVREWDRLQLPKALDTKKVRSKIINVGSSKIGNVFYTKGTKIYARNIVGLIDIGTIQIQILPKIYDQNGQEKDSSYLLNLLLRSGIDFKFFAMRASTSEVKLPFLESIIRKIGEDLYKELCDNQPRRYHRINMKSLTLKGRIDFSEKARSRPGTDHIIPIQFSPLQSNNELSQLIKATAFNLYSITRNSYTKSIFAKCLMILSDVKLVPLSDELAHKIKLTRLESQWVWLLDIAKLLSSGYSIDAVTPGTSRGVSILFPLEYLFERTLRSLFKRATAFTDWSLFSKKNNKRLLRRHFDNQEFLTLKPDYLFINKNEVNPCIVGDAKWKRLDFHKRNLGLDVKDLYQITTYIHRFKLKNGMIFFPSKQPIKDVFKGYEYRLIADDSKLTIVEVDIFNLLKLEKSNKQQLYKLVVSYIDKIYSV